MHRSFNYDEEKLKHPHVIYERRGRPSAKLERHMVKTVARPFVDAVLNIIRRGVKPALSEEEYLFFNYDLCMDSGIIRRNFLDVVLVHDGNGTHISGLICRVHLAYDGASQHIGTVQWYRRQEDNGWVYETIAEKPREFRELFVSAILFIFGRCTEIE